MITEAPDRNRSIWNRFIGSLFGAPASRALIRTHARRVRAFAEPKNHANHRRKVAERNQARRQMAAASRRRNRG